MTEERISVEMFVPKSLPDSTKLQHVLCVSSWSLAVSDWFSVSSDAAFSLVC